MWYILQLTPNEKRKGRQAQREIQEESRGHEAQKGEELDLLVQDLEEERENSEKAEIVCGDWSLDW